MYIQPKGMRAGTKNQWQISYRTYCKFVVNYINKLKRIRPIFCSILFIPLKLYVSFIPDIKHPKGGAKMQ